MSRLLKIALLAAAVAAIAHYLYDRDEGVPASGNGHSGDSERNDMLRERIAAARQRLRDEFDSVRGDDRR